MPRRGHYSKQLPGQSRASLTRHRRALREAARKVGGGGEWCITFASPGKLVLQRREAVGGPTLVREQLNQVGQINFWSKNF